MLILQERSGPRSVSDGDSYTPPTINFSPKSRAVSGGVLDRERKLAVGKRNCLTLHCPHQNEFCIKQGSNENNFIVHNCEGAKSQDSVAETGNRTDAARLPT